MLKVSNLKSVSAAWWRCKAWMCMPRGAILGVIGMNGSGKTTMLNCINGIYTPDEGRIELDGRDIAGRQVHEVARLGVGAPSRCRASSAS